MIGFYHPSRGYWEIEEGTPQRYVDAYPEGTVLTGPRPSPEHTFDGTTWSVNDRIVHKDEVNAERDRRVLVGTVIDVAGYGPVRVAGDPMTQTNLLGLVQAASLRVSQGDMTTITHYRDEDNVIHELVPMQIIDLWSKGSGFVSAVFQASWALKDNPEGIPLDYAEDNHWPA